MPSIFKSLDLPSLRAGSQSPPPANEGPEETLERLLRYILNAELKVPALKERIAKLHGQPLKNKTMTLADRLREEGKIEGITEGKQAGITEGRLRALRETVLCALEIRHGDYPEGIREVIETVNDPATLNRLLASAIRSNSVEEFAQNL